MATKKHKPMEPTEVRKIYSRILRYVERDYRRLDSLRMKLKALKESDTFANEAGDMMNGAYVLLDRAIDLLMPELRNTRRVAKTGIWKK